LKEAGQQIAPRTVELRNPARLSRPFFWLSAFYFVYCARPEDWIRVLGYVPLAKITAVFALLGLLSSLGKTQRKFRDLPRESNYLLAMIGVLFVSALLSPIWKAGALGHTLDFAKIYMLWVLTFLLVTDFLRLRRIIFIQSGSVAVISIVSLILGHNRPRLEGVIGGIYSNPNDLAFAIVLTLPLCLAFLLSAKGVLVRLCWTGAILIMGFTLFKTASRAGFIDLVISGTVCLWHFGVKGRRLYLLVASGLIMTFLLIVAGGPLASRMMAISGRADNQEEGKAYGSYLQIAVEGGIPSLIFYLLFFGTGFRNLRKLRRRRDLDVQTTLFVGGLHSSMIGFVVGALFAPEAYQFFPYFSVAYTSVLVALIGEHEQASEPQLAGRDWRSRGEVVRANKRESDDFTLVH
jgi:hypothetical protein